MSMPPRSPLQRAVATLIESLYGPTPGAVFTIDRSPKPTLGEVRVRVACSDDGPVSSELLAKVAADLSGHDEIRATRIIPPRVYLTLDPNYIQQTVVAAAHDDRNFGRFPDGIGRRVILSFSDPNVNKPLHLGHLRNNFLGMALCRLLEGAGWSVECQADHNDWGLPLCQTVVAYRRWGGGATPESTDIKEDHFVGQFYVRFHEENRKEGGDTPSALDVAAASALHLLEKGDPETVAIGRRLTAWAEDGIEATYRRINTRIDCILFGSQYIDAGNGLLSRGIAANQLAVRSDGSVYADLSNEKLGEVTLVRHDGTPLFYRQWLAMDVDRFGHGGFDRAIILNGREWRPGFATFFAVLRRLGHYWVDDLEPIYYGMVNLPEGRMSSRRGALVIVDDLIDAVAERLAVDAPNAEVAERTAVALLGWHFLRHNREADLAYDEGDVWRTSLPQVLRCAALLSRDEGDGHRGAGGAAGGSAATNGVGAVHQILIEVDRLPEVAALAVAALEPARVVRYIERLVGLVARASSRQPIPSHVLAAAARTAGIALNMVNIQLPALPWELITHGRTAPNDALGRARRPQRADQ